MSHTTPLLRSPGSARGPRPGARGFTLVELMIAISVTGILSSLALPTFEGQLQRARRSDVLVSVMQIQAAQERYRSNSASYGSAVDVGAPGVSTAGHYLLQTTANQAGGYDVVATATGMQARDIACRHMKLSALGSNFIYASGPDASTANPAAGNRRCWGL
jgi:type IV pilus assembly protein PilE